MEQMTLPGIDILEWQYDEDNGNVMCRCPECGGRLIIHYYTYENPYHFCPYCGVRLQENERGLVAKRSEVYGNTKDEEKRIRKDIKEWREDWRRKYERL